MKDSWQISYIKNYLSRTSLFTRIAVGNALVIVTGAFFGTLLTRHFSSIIDGWLIGLFAILGIGISLLVNFLILHAALQPLRKLRRMAERMTDGDLVQLDGIKNPDLDTGNLYSSLQLLIEQLELRNKQLHAISERIINVQEEERKSISRSLHDDTGQALTMMIFNLDQMEAIIPPENEKIAKLVEDSRTLASNALTELRRIVFGLRPAILDDLGLESAIRWYARSNLNSNIIIDVDEPIPDLPPRISTTLYRIAQEGINNIVRHADANNVRISIIPEDNNIHLCIQDDGKGMVLSSFSTSDVKEDHLGLLGLKERVELLGGELTLESKPGSGVSLEVILPIWDN
ncbi:MAG: sensor histidine kinase [Anaerolineales bacterium]